MAAIGLTAASGWLGGHLAYAQGVGVDTTVFELLPTEWTDLCSVDEVTDKPSRHEVGGVGVVAFRAGSELVAMADRCTHRGGPLHEGELDPPVASPAPGTAARSTAPAGWSPGPATRPQPALEVRVENGRVQVRRDEERSLRLNPVS